MANIIQKQFRAFHEEIKLDVNDNKELVAKKEMLVDEIRDYLKKMCEEKGIKLIRFITLNQGSYSMGTGIKPMHAEDDYDIDCGLLFDINRNDYTPVEVKQWVHDALNIHLRTVEWKKACVRVQYIEAGLPKFHVDFAVYADGNNDQQTYIAKGTPTLAVEHKKWEISEPKRLRDLINNRFTPDEDCQQFKRVIRYLKRWKDFQFDSVNGKPTGIAITALAYNGFTPFTEDAISRTQEINDLKALKSLVNYIINQFGYFGKIRVHLPVAPGNNLFEKMTDAQGKTLRGAFENLRDALEKAEAETDPHEACKLLAKQFGDSFPVPAKEQTAQNRAKAIAGTSESA